MERVRTSFPSGNGAAERRAASAKVSQPQRAHDAGIVSGGKSLQHLPNYRQECPQATGDSVQVSHGRGHGGADFLVQHQVGQVVHRCLVPVEDGQPSAITLRLHREQSGGRNHE